MVFDSRFDTTKVVNTPKTIIAVNKPADSNELKAPPEVPIKNIVMIAIRVGNLPLQGTKLLVIIAIKRSRGESIILQPIIPAALHPKPMHMDG